MFVTFMPKPTTGDWRSGAHMNTSLVKIKQPGKNIYEGAGGKFSQSAYHAVGGMLRHGAAITAVACSTVNSYNGLVPKVAGFEGGVYTWAPTHITYGHNNRSAMLRLPQNRFCIENRAADMCMNPYLGLGMSLAAAVDGIVNKLDPGPSADEDLYVMDAKRQKKLTALPRNLLEATEQEDSIMVIGLPLSLGGLLFNTGLVIQQGRILGPRLARYDIRVNDFLPGFSTQADWDQTARVLTDQYSPANILSNQ